MTRRAVAGDPAPVILDDAVNHGQAQAGAGTDALGRKKGIEDALEGRLVHTGPGIGDLQHDIRSGRRLGRAPVVLARRGHGGANRQASPIRHGVRGVDPDVQYDLLDLIGIHLDRHEVHGQVFFDRDHLGDGARQDVKGLVHDRIQRQRLEIAFDLAAEGQELAGQLAGPLGGGFDFLKRPGIQAPRRLVQKQQLRISGNGLQEVVEVVGDSAGQGADRLHFDGMDELSLQRLAAFLGLDPGGDILERAHGPGRPPGVVRHQSGPEVDPARG